MISKHSRKNNPRKHCTVDWGIFTLKIIRVKILAVLFNLRNFFNGSQLQCGRVPGGFLTTGIRRARYRWLYIVVDQTFTSGRVGGSGLACTLVH